MIFLLISWNWPRCWIKCTLTGGVPRWSIAGRGAAVLCIGASLTRWRTPRCHPAASPSATSAYTSSAVANLQREPDSPCASSSWRCLGLSQAWSSEGLYSHHAPGRRPRSATHRVNRADHGRLRPGFEDDYGLAGLREHRLGPSSTSFRASHSMAAASYEQPSGR